MLSKNQLIEGIRAINSTAEPAWLEHFDVSSLRQYLDHLNLTRQPRDRHSRWLRENRSPAAVTRRPLD